MIKICVSTSEKYYHLLPVFIYLFQKYWNKEQPVEIVGYSKPDIELPANFTFHSMGVQGEVNEWSTDLRKYFESIPEDRVVYIMEDSFLKSVNIKEVELAYKKTTGYIGRFDLTNDVQKRDHNVLFDLVYSSPRAKYRLSTQPSVWNKKFLLQYLVPGLSPWDFECLDPKNDGWKVLGFLNPPIISNEGVRKFDPHKLDLNGFPQIDIDYINTLLYE